MLGPRFSTSRRFRRWGATCVGSGLALGVGVGVMACPESAAASQLRIRSRTVAEAYAVQSAADPSLLLRRRRLAQYVSLGVYDMLPPREADAFVRAPEDGQLQLVASMRLRHDFGDWRSNAGPSSGPLIESSDGRQIDLLYGYLQGDRLAHGWLDMRVGRQFEQSGLDWYVFDGGFFRLRLPVHLGVETFAGLSVRGDDVFGYPTFELDGTQGRASDRALQPMVGAGVSIIDSAHFSGRVAYRRVFSPARDQLDADQQPLESAVDQEFVSAALSGSFFQRRFSPHGALRFDLAGLRISDASLGAYWAVTDRHRLRVGFLRTRPTFDLDSIFNVFSSRAFEDYRLTWEVDTNPRWTVAARGQVRTSHADTTVGGSEPESKTRPSGGGGVMAAWRSKRSAIRLDAHALTGEGGTQWGGAADSRTMVWADRLALDLRAYGVRYANDDSTGRQGWAFATQAGVDARLWRGIHLAVMGEEMFSPLWASSFRLWGVLSAEWDFRGGPR